jgi:2-hydroxymuconate-semialdehyde hydrolase
MTAATLVPTQIDVGGVATTVIDTGTPGGQHGPPVLLLHGSGPGVTAIANWRPVIPALATGRRVIAPDQLGFGGTATGEQRTYGRGAWTEHALALLDTLGSPPSTSSAIRWAAPSHCQLPQPGRARRGASC